jgi:hypothetical protein
MGHLLAIIVPPVIGLITYAILRFLLARSEKHGDDVAL